ncbi:transketolase [Thiohalorhabdus denitrificans]|uniref:Transketolase n=1 Tax=Thiohalorhabdus denitrificans TaxID=381306 RepID=A0A0P9CEV3_9GAMM|nr:transketolase [Thiohalorhabdus denitrificans]KPV41481.1 transketolase [Thiohalorhabdus denitrificans]SCY28976.1 transketolase [Thiohalorhabdus denitrificans]
MAEVSRKQLANAIRFLSMDAVQAANSGHPGAPMGMADIAEVLWNDYMKHNPGNPDWADRDRFVLSNGHGSMLVYSLLHLTGYDLPLEELKNFRQWGSKTPGHPENGVTPGVETTTGPLGQGLANAVGMAIAEKELANEFNRDGHDVIDHYTYAFAGDGCLMEGVSHEACSLAGTLGLGKLIVFYDDNGISIDGEVEDWFTDDTLKRFEGYEWQTMAIDGHNPDAVAKAIEQAKAEPNKPTLIACKTTIGYGSPNLAGSEATHGAPLGEDEVAATRKALGWEHGPFEVPEDVYAGWDARETGKKAEADWQERFEAYRKDYPEKAAELERRMKQEVPGDFEATMDAIIKEYREGQKSDATRKHSGAMLNTIAAKIPEVLGGSADLAPSNNTKWKDAPIITPAKEQRGVHGRYLHYGVREFGMAAIMNGISLHRGYRPYGGTFLIFSDYMRNGIRMSALMHQPVTYVFTHDSIGLGEDGPTHQPVEQVSSLRAIPGVHVFRPADAVETAVGWKLALGSGDHPYALVLTRQKTGALDHTDETVANIAKGGYVVSEAEGGSPEGILLASGSEVDLALKAQAELASQGKKVRVVSMPCMELFEAQDEAYKQSVLPDSVSKRVAVEAGQPMSWYRYVGRDGKAIGMERFGESAPGDTLFEKFGFVPATVVSAYNDLG